MRLRWLVLAGCVLGALLGALAVSRVAVAGPPGPPSFGVMEPASNACPWPDFLNPVLDAGGVGKCLPASIAWSENGVRVVTDPLVGTGGAAGWVTFWCQSTMGFRFSVGAVGLAPTTTYAVTATGFGTIAALHTDANGGGVVGGIVKLPPGGYDVAVSVGSALASPASDLVGFEVLAPSH
jgi:hypothetical protein